MTTAGIATATAAHAGKNGSSALAGPNFRLGTPPLYYDIRTTAQFVGPVRVCVTTSSGGVGALRSAVPARCPNGHADAGAREVARAVEDPLIAEEPSITILVLSTG